MTRDELWVEFHCLLPTVAYGDFLEHVADISFVFQSPRAHVFGYKKREAITNDEVYREVLSLARSEAGVKQVTR